MLLLAEERLAVQPDVGERGESVESQHQALVRPMLWPRKCDSYTSRRN